MAFAFSRSETVAKGMRRIADEQLAAAIGELQNAELSHERAIHQVRRRLKMVRGLLRLVRPGMEEVARSESRLCGDIAGELSGLRDADIMVRTCRLLGERGEGRITPAMFDAVDASIAAFRAELAAQGTDPAELRSRTITRLKERREAVREWSLTGLETETLFEGLSRNYRRGRRRLAVALDTEADEDLHGWRKRCKDYWYHIRLLRKSWPDMLNWHAKLLESLCDDLGQDHDLAVLSEVISRIPDCEPLAVFESEIRGWRGALRKRAFSQGTRLFVESPEDIAARFREYWRLWKRRHSER